MPQPRRSSVPGLVTDAYGRTEAEYWALQKPHVAVVLRSADAKEGPRAFAEKRAPVWSGR